MRVYFQSIFLPSFSSIYSHLCHPLMLHLPSVPQAGWRTNLNVAESNGLLIFTEANELLPFSTHFTLWTAIKFIVISTTF